MARKDIKVETRDIVRYYAVREPGSGRLTQVKRIKVRVAPRRVMVIEGDSPKTTKFMSVEELLEKTSPTRRIALLRAGHEIASDLQRQLEISIRNAALVREALMEEGGPGGVHGSAMDKWEKARYYCTMAFEGVAKALSEDAEMVSELQGGLA